MTRCIRWEHEYGAGCSSSSEAPALELLGAGLDQLHAEDPGLLASALQRERLLPVKRSAPAGRSAIVEAGRQAGQRDGRDLAGQGVHQGSAAGGVDAPHPAQVAVVPARLEQRRQRPIGTELHPITGPDAR